jgi:hypothetical protein
VKAVVGTTIAVAALILAGAVSAKERVPGCASSAPRRGPSGLPATLSLATRCADFQLRPDGSIHPNGRGILHEAPPRSLGYGDGVWWYLTADRLTADSSGERLWHSSRRYTQLFDLQGAAVGTNAVAFTYRSRLFVAARGRPERLVARAERPLGWSRDGLLFTSRGRDVVLRGADGTFVAVVERKARVVRFDLATKAVLTVTRDARVARFDGRSATSLARLRDLGLPVWSWVEPLAAGLVGITAGRRVAILRADGSLFASAIFPTGRRWNAAGNSGLVADPNGHAVALTLTEGNTGYASDGAEWLLLLREGDRVARVLHREPLRFAVCERWTTLAWRDDWLLYSSTEGRTLALNTRRRRLVDLTRLVARLPGARPDAELKVELRARWAVT